jgi:hypothetical protein
VLEYLVSPDGHYLDDPWASSWAFSGQQVFFLGDCETPGLVELFAGSLEHARSSASPPRGTVTHDG